MKKLFIVFGLIGSVYGRSPITKRNKSIAVEETGRTFVKSSVKSTIPSEKNQKQLAEQEQSSLNSASAPEKKEKIVCANSTKLDKPSTEIKKVASQRKPRGDETNKLTKAEIKPADNFGRTPAAKRPAEEVKELEEIKKPRILLDESVAIVYGPEKKALICASQTDRMGLDGRKRTLDDLIFEELTLQEAIKFKVPCGEEMVDKYMSEVGRKNNLSKDDFKQIFRSSGYSYEDGREALRRMNVSNMMIEHKIKARLFVPTSDIEKYYQGHPTYKESKYELQTALVPFTNKPKDYVSKQIAQFKKTGKSDLVIDWSNPFWVKESEVAEFIAALSPGSIAEPQETKKGFELFKLVRKKEKRLVSLEKRHREIAEILRKPKFEQMMTQYQKELRDNASIVYLQEGLAVAGDTSPAIED